MLVYAIVDDAISHDFPLGVELEVFIRREDAEQFIEQRAAPRASARHGPNQVGDGVIVVLALGAFAA
jgi:hypothetical protein